MIKVLMFDLSYTLLFPKNKSYVGELNRLHKDLLPNQGYNFSEYFYLDMDQLNFIKNLKSKYDLCIFTSGTIQNAAEIKSLLTSVFSKIYSADEIGIGKKDTRSYEYIVKDLKVKPSEVLFIDDTSVNVETALAANLNALVYKNFRKLKTSIKQYIASS